MAEEAQRDQQMRLLGKSEAATEESLLDEGRDDFEPGDQRPAAGGLLNIWQTSLMVAGGTSGYGFLAVDLLVVSTGWLGLAVFTALWAAATFTGVLLGRCWNAVRDGRGRGTERHPYGAIGLEAFGGWARSLTNILVGLASFATTIGVLLASAETTMLLGGTALRGTFCYWPLISALVLCPVFWLGTPKDFWWILAFSFFSVVLTTPFIVVSNSLVAHSAATNITAVLATDSPQETAVLRLAEMASVLVWVTGAHYFFPTVQQDMKQPQRFSEAVLLGEASTMLVVLPVMLSLYIAYGGTLTRVTGDMTALTLLPEGALKSATTALILTHLLSGALLTNNPIFQYVEEILDIQTEFGWKRAVVRSSILLAQVFIQETLPHVSLVSAFTVGLLTPLLVFLMPPLFYLRLRGSPSLGGRGSGEKSVKSAIETAVCWLLIVATPFIMATILYVTVSEMIRGRTVFTVPCYVDPTKAHV